MKRQMKCILALALSVCLVLGNTQGVMAANASEETTESIGGTESTAETDMAEADTTEVTEPEPTEADTTEAPEADTTETPEAAGTEPTEAAEPEPTEAAEPDTAEAPEADTTEAPEADTTEAPEAAETDTTEAAEPEPTEAAETDTTEATEPEPTEATEPESADKDLQLILEEAKTKELAANNLQVGDTQLTVMDASKNAVATFGITYSSAYSALQDALDYARDNASSSNILTIYIPTGTYIIDTTLNIYGNTVLDLSAGNVVIKRSSSCSSSLFRFGRSSDGNVSGYTGFENITIKGNSNSYAVLNGGGVSTSILRFAHAQNVTMKYLTFTNVKDAHHVEFAGSNNVVVDHCNFTGFKLSSSSDITNYEALQLDILQKSHFGNYGAYDDTVNKNITISNNVFDGLNRGVGTHSGEVGKYFNNIQITGNTFKDITGYAVVATNYKDSTISNNSITNCGAGIYFRHSTPGRVNYYKGNEGNISTNANTTISENVISIIPSSFDDACYGIRVYGEKLKSDKGSIPKGDYRVKNINITGNSLSISTQANGIWFKGVYESNINGNTITYKTSKKVDGDCDGIKLEYSVNDTISNNTIQDISGKYSFVRSGVYIKSSSNGNTVKSNLISTTKQNGIYVTKSKSVLLDSNTIYDASKHGIYLNNGGATKITHNTIKKKNNKYSSKRGICVNGSKSYVKEISSNIIENCKEHGIMINHSATIKTIKNNTITSVKQNGIYVNSKSKVSKISKNKITKAKNIGIAIYSNKKKIKISSNSISRSSVYGIDIGKGTKATITGNTITKSKKGMIKVQSANNKRAKIGKTKITKIKASKGKVTIKWKKAKGAKKYIVYRSTSKKGKYKRIKTVTSRKYTDKRVKKGKTYYYKIVPSVKYDKVTISSKASKIKKAKAK